MAVEEEGCDDGWGETIKAAEDPSSRTKESN
jgi:hypothetical protein